MEQPTTTRRSRVAVVGTGMAGLVTAWLLQQDSANNYVIEIFESGPRPSLDSQSVSVTNSKTKGLERIDVPMRAFTEGYYRNLIRMYTYFGIDYRVQPFLFSFSRLPRTGQCREQQYFIHSSNNHQIPPHIPPKMGLMAYTAELACALICYLWFSACCLWIPAATDHTTGLCETFERYLERILLPRYFIRYYLLPLMSAVTTCPHKTLLDFPARDILEYKKLITSGRQLTVSQGVKTVQEKLLAELQPRFGARVSSVETVSNGVQLRWQDGITNQFFEDLFDRVVFAVPPNVVGEVFQPLRRTMSRIPTASVYTIVHHDETMVPNQVAVPSVSGPAHHKAHVIHLKTDSGIASCTEATHVQPSGAMVTSCPLTKIDPESVLHSAHFTRVLRTPESREIVNQLFCIGVQQPPVDEKTLQWRNGDGGVFLVGSWCWDGMVLLEGCVVSAMRTARLLGVRVPWEGK